MNDTFNLTRFGFFMKKTLVERAVQIGGCFALVAILTGLFYCTIVNVTMSYYEGGNQRVAFSVGLILGSGYISAMLFAHFFDKFIAIFGNIPRVVVLSPNADSICKIWDITRKCFDC